MKKIYKIVLLLSLLLNLTIFYVGYKAYEYRTHINFYMGKYLKVVDEMAQTEIYAKSNQQLKSDTIVPGRVVFFGTQLIEQWNLAEDFPEYKAVNRGVPTQRAAGMVLRYWPDVIELKPQAVVIEISSYNFRPYNRLEQLKSYLTTMCDLARFHNIEPLPLTISPPTKGFLTTEVAAEMTGYNVYDSVAVFNNWLRNYCEQNSLKLVDSYEGLVDSEGYLKEEFAENLIGLNRGGYNILKSKIKTELADIL